MDPVVVNDPFTEEIKQKIMPLIKKIPDVKNIHDFRVVKGPTHTNIIFDVLMNIECKKSDDSIKKEVIDIIKNIDNSYNAVITIDRDYINY